MSVSYFYVTNCMYPIPSSGGLTALRAEANCIWGPPVKILCDNSYY